MVALVKQKSWQWRRELASFLIVMLVASPFLLKPPIRELMNRWSRRPAYLTTQPSQTGPQAPAPDQWQASLLDLQGQVHQLKDRDRGAMHWLQQLSQQAHGDLDQLDAELRWLEQNEQAIQELFRKP